MQLNFANEEVVTSEMPQDYITAHNLKSNFDLLLNNFEKLNQEEAMLPDTFEFPYQVDGQNDKLDENLIKPTTSAANMSVFGSALPGGQSAPPPQSKFIIRMPNSTQPFFSNLNMSANQPAKIVINTSANKSLLHTGTAMMGSANTHVHTTTATTSTAKVFNMSSQFINFSNIRTTSSTGGASSNLSGMSTMPTTFSSMATGDKPSVIRFENTLSSNTSGTTSVINAPGVSAGAIPAISVTAPAAKKKAVNRKTGEKKPSAKKAKPKANLNSLQVLKHFVSCLYYL